MRQLGGIWESIHYRAVYRDKTKLKWWYKLATMLEDRYLKKLFSQDWNIKPHRGRERKVWSRLIDGLFVSLEIDKVEWL